MNFLSKNWYLLCLVIAGLCISCNKDKDGSDVSPLTPEEHKARLEKIGKNFVSKFNPQDQEKPVKAIQYFMSISEDPGLLEGSNGGSNEELASCLNAVQSLVTNNDINGLAIIATKAAGTMGLADYAGTYVHNANNGEWTKTAASNKISLQFNNGAACVMDITFEGGKEYQTSSDRKIKIPAKVNFKMTINSVEQITFSVEPSLSDDLKSIHVAVKASLIGGYTWGFSAGIKSSAIEINYNMYKNGEVLMGIGANVTGNNLSPDKINVGNFSRGELNFRIMEAAIKGSGDIKAIIDNLDKIPGTATDKEEANLTANILNQHAALEMYYADEDQKIADVKMRSTTDYDVVPELIFASDGSKYEMEVFFDKAYFTSLINAANTLVKGYTELIYK